MSAMESTTTVTVVCQTPGCGNEGVEITLEVSTDSFPDVFVCGVCSQTITAAPAP